MNENFETPTPAAPFVQSRLSGFPLDNFDKKASEPNWQNQSDTLSMLSILDRTDKKSPSAKSDNEHTTEQSTPTESAESFDKRVAESLSGRMAEKTFSQLADFESGNGLNFSDVQRMHRLVPTKHNPGPDDYMKTSSDLICTETLTPAASGSGGLHLTEDQFRRFVRDQIEQLQPTSDGPAISDPIPVSLIVDGQNKEVEATLQITEDATGDVIL